MNTSKGGAEEREENSPPRQDPTCRGGVMPPSPRTRDDRFQAPKQPATDSPVLVTRRTPKKMVSSIGVRRGGRIEPAVG